MRASVVIGGLAALLAVVGVIVVLSGDGEPAEEGVEQEGSRRSEGRGKAPRSRRRGGVGDPDAPGGDEDDPDLERRVAKLEREVATLRRQLAITSGRRVASASSDDYELTEEVDSPVFDSAVRDIVAEERQREREERWRRFTERALSELTEATGLDSERQTAIAALWDTEREKLTPLIQSARSGEASFDEVREEIQKVREESDAEARKVLNDEEYESYLEHRPRGPGGRGRGGRDRGGDRGAQGGERGGERGGARSGERGGERGG